MQWAILAGIPEEDARRVLQVARRRTFARREVVFHRGDPADTLHLVHTGHFAVSIGTRLGDSVMLAMVRPGETFGEIALLDDTAPRSATVLALEGGETHAIHKLDFDALCARHPGVADVLARALALRVRRLSELLVEAHHESADRRVLRRLAEFGDEGGIVPLTQEELAHLAGTSRATVNRIVRDAQSRGELALSRGRIELLDVAALSARAN
jgi:CRP/FNR family cyclic AMP-dependent transcriptional regulator